MKNLIVTVAIASYNNARYIDRCIDSVIKQTYKNLEILIVDDGSSDNTEKKLKCYENEKRIKIVRKNNGGLSSVRQLALDTARGDYICFIDADDYLSELYVEVMLNRLVQTASDICVCGTRFEDEKGKILNSFSKMFECHDSTESYKPLYSEMNQYGNQKVGELHVSDSWNKMYNLYYLRKCHIKFCMPNGLNGSDELFNRLLLVHRPNYITVSNELYVHVMYQNSAVHRKSRNLMASFAFILDLMINECRKIGILNELNIYLSNYYISSLYAGHLDILKDGVKDFSAIHLEDEKLKRMHAFLCHPYYKNLPANILIFFFIYKKCNSFLLILFNMRVCLRELKKQYNQLLCRL